MRQLRIVGLAALLVAATASAASAQRNVQTSNRAAADKFWEFGVDFVGITMELDPGDQTAITLGSGVVRAGRSITPTMTIEPAVFLFRTSGGGTSSSFFQTEAGLLYHFQAQRTARQFYVRPLLIFQRTSGGGASDSNMGFGVGGGIKLPSKRNPRFTYRGEVTYRSIDQSGTTASDLTISGGVSVYNR